MLLLNTFNLAPIFEALQTDVENDCQLEQRLINNYPNNTNEIMNLFQSYGLGCPL